MKQIDAKTIHTTTHLYCSEPAVLLRKPTEGAPRVPSFNQGLPNSQFVGVHHNNEQIENKITYHIQPSFFLSFSSIVERGKSNAGELDVSPEWNKKGKGVGRGATKMEDCWSGQCS